MKKFLIATTALVATAGFAQAEIAVSGEAKAGLIYNSEGDEKAKLHSEVLLTFDGTGETDGGLQFGFNANMIVEDNGEFVKNDDTTVYLSGAFGKLSFGAVAEADEVAGLSDIGWEGLDVDDVAETLVGDELGDLADVSLGHNVNYTYATGPLSFSLSGRLDTTHAGDGVDSYAAGMKYNFGDAYVGLGYGDHDLGTAASVFGTGTTALGKAQVVSLYGGATFGAIKVAALYADGRLKDTTGAKSDAQSYGLNASYTMDALTVAMGYSKAKFDANTMGFMDQEALGLGASYNLGGGASLHGGIARVESVGDENQGTRLGKKAKETRADFGVTFKF